MRISREQMFMMMARTVSLRSTCPRLNVGAIITLDNNVISMGYNGSRPNEAHCIDKGCEIKKGGCVRTIHAEANAISRMGGRLFDYDLQLYVTHSPCINCAELITSTDIKEVYFEVPYRKPEPIALLLDEGIKVYQVSPSGHITSQGDAK